jgi:hypothetical protein
MIFWWRTSVKCFRYFFCRLFAPFGELSQQFYLLLVAMFGPLSHHLLLLTPHEVLKGLWSLVGSASMVGLMMLVVETLL